MFLQSQRERSERKPASGRPSKAVVTPTSPTRTSLRSRTEDNNVKRKSVVMTCTLGKLNKFPVFSQAAVLGDTVSQVLRGRLRLNTSCSPMSFSVILDSHTPTELHTHFSTLLCCRLFPVVILRRPSISGDVHSMKAKTENHVD